MIKKFNEFINESVGPNKSGSVSVNLSEEESELFTSEPKLSELIHDKKVALLTPELWFDENDTETISTLNNYFDVNIESNIESTNEEFINDEEQEYSNTSLICPYCDHEQEEHPDNILDNTLTGGVQDESGSTDYGECECEKCHKPFEFSKQIEVRYYTMKIKGVNEALVPKKHKNDTRNADELKAERKLMMDEIVEIGKKIRKLEKEKDDAIKDIHSMDDRIKYRKENPIED